jgi:hypothetical protein
MTSRARRRREGALDQDRSQAYPQAHGGLTRALRREEGLQAPLKLGPVAARRAIAEMGSQYLRLARLQFAVDVDVDLPQRLFTVNR